MSHFGLFAAAAVVLLTIAVHSDAASVMNPHHRASGFGDASSAADGSKTVVKRQAGGIGSEGGMLGGGAEAFKGGIDAFKTGIQTGIEMGKTAASGGIKVAEKVQG